MGVIIYYGVIFKSPEETGTGMWQVTTPGRDVIEIDTEELVKRVTEP